MPTFTFAFGSFGAFVAAADVLIRTVHEIRGATSSSPDHQALLSELESLKAILVIAGGVVERLEWNGRAKHLSEITKCFVAVHLFIEKDNASLSSSPTGLEGLYGPIVRAWCLPAENDKLKNVVAVHTRNIRMLLLLSQWYGSFSLPSEGTLTPFL